MRISVVHHTLYRYSSPVYLEPHVIRLRPRQDAAQRLEAWNLEITPAPEGRYEGIDQEGNNVVRAWFQGQYEELAVHSTFTLETLRDDPFAYLPAKADLQLPMQYALPLRTPLAPYLGEGESAPVRALSRELAEASGWQTLPFLTAINLRLLETTSQVIRLEGAPNPAEETLRTGEGSCRDLAVLFCAVCRTMGLAARFVSGYERDASLQENGDLHAWAEVYLEGSGWIGYDPSRGLAVASSHVAVAAAIAPENAAPVTGTFRGKATAQLEHSIAMQVG
ncbi:MAG: transglutaminase family protein [Candidatus Solibacter sp.]